MIRGITVGLAAYGRHSDWSIEEAARSRDAVEALFRVHGVDPVEDWTDAATTQQIAGKLTDWSKRWDESQVVYWTGHGEFNGDGYFLALADSDELSPNDALSHDRLFSALRALERARVANDSQDWVLVILDTCGSGPGGWKLWTLFQSPPKNVGVVATTDDGAAYSGAFPRHLEAALDSFNGNDTDGIPLAELVRRLEVVIGAEKINAKFGPLAVLPIRTDAAPAIQATVDVYAELRHVLADASPPSSGTTSTPKHKARRSENLRGTSSAASPNAARSPRGCARRRAECSSFPASPDQGNPPSSAWCWQRPTRTCAPHSLRPATIRYPMTSTPATSASTP